MSRLDAAKGALRQAVEALPCGSKVGWAIFTEYRSYLLFTPVEVCANRADLRSTLAAIDGRMAWSGNSEIAKGVHSGITISKALPGTPSLVFITDGQEAPPLEDRRPLLGGEGADGASRCPRVGCVLEGRDVEASRRDRRRAGRESSRRPTERCSPWIRTFRRRASACSSGLRERAPERRC